MLGLLRLWFLPTVPVDRRAYLASGLGLATLKLAVDNAIVYAGTGHLWPPWAYLIPSVVLRDELSAHATPGWVHAGLAAAALPFLWIGLSMSVRRAVDAGWSPLAGFGFLVPGLNYLTIALLAAPPSRKVGEEIRTPVASAAPYRDDKAPDLVETNVAPTGVVLDGLLASMVGGFFGLGMVVLAVSAFRSYGLALFFLAPCATGMLVALLFNRRGRRGLMPTLVLTLLTAAGVGTSLLLFAIEGLVCIAMAAPLALGASALTAGITYALVSGLPRRLTSPGASLVLLLVPGAIGAEAAIAEPTLRQVVTSIEVDAPPAAVWPHVVGFSELDPPPEWFFRLGIAYPMRARLEGEGVGAVRHCEFSTGPFVEPITRWEPPHRLAFDVASQPPSMTELSPYRHLDAPHLEGYMQSRRGQFRLVPVDGGTRTRIEGTTWYTLAIYPEAYWVIPAELLLHAIHRRVLAHIKDLAEAGPPA